MIKLIGIDLDDTLLDSDKLISKDNCEAIKQAIQCGIHVVITTGRPYFRIVDYLKMLNLYNDHSYVITYNGSMISNATRSIVLDEQKLTNQDIRFIMEKLKCLGLHFNIYKKTAIYSEEVLPLIKEQKVFSGIVFDIKTYQELLNIEDASKIIICEQKETIDKMREEVERMLAGRFNILRSTDLYLEILPKEANKGLALNKLMEYLEVAKDEAMAIGDEENDEPMFAFVKYKIAMGNGNEAIKKHATFVTKSQNESGVAFAINKYINV